MEIVDRVGLSPEQLAALRAEIEGHVTLERVVRWGLARSPQRWVEDVVVQDEFTHDVILPIREGLVLVYDAT